ncbi:MULTISPECIES: alpha-ketoglutarate-dependent dioxygenase AlkB [unclassified Pseudoalteromonas]|uniref:alpha-ketoglutarate-dependent dioxygenase AlkB family protein n=1 Tax=unclassified Pseudoalteromonas TaxID=194690 RepID=UPI001EF00BAE|nr:alpha-ketoglutarate-dependent dioxygenase AlkB [Pseudoalteromonas sp. L21]MCF7518806.1 alpha-ketoglutarate-dependent dioxygenase AlkB [Pseudoalteromonas sp. L21]UJX26313.1 alpha-ketoglutarate-dependent dioxygenase AlkB [Pseudoalteromonas sp. CF6-2]
MQQPNAKPNHLPEGFYYQQKALSAQKSLDLFYFLQQHLNWQQPNITVFGKTHPIPRLQCFIADEQINYAYSGTQLVVEPWPEVLDAMRKRLSQQLRIPFNALLVNLYRDGQDCMGWHSDDEKELGEQPTIASISLGAERVFKIKHKHSNEKQSILLQSGSCLIMNGFSQRDYQHSLPKQQKLMHPRINLTFRSII